MGQLGVGMTAPDFAALDQHGVRRTLSELLEAGRLVLYFYPRDFTPVCTAQACTFRDSMVELAARQARVVGVSSDSVESHRAFAAKHGVDFPLLSDPDFKICDAYSGRYWLFKRTRRVTYVIDPSRKVLGVFEHELSAQKHLDDVLRLLSS